MRFVSFHYLILSCVLAIITRSACMGIEINHSTSFVEVPTEIRLINYSWYAFEGGAKYNFVLNFPLGAQASLGGIELQQIRGVSPAFYYGPVSPKAYLGIPRKRGESIPVSADFSNDNRNISIKFPQPILPGSTITIEFNVVTNPPMDLYLFSVSAVPFGPNPIVQDVGVVQMNILEDSYFD